MLVTGANGQLGREMRRLGAASPNEYTFTDVAELDITDAAAVMAALTPLQTAREVMVAPVSALISPPSLVTATLDLPTN